MSTLDIVTDVSAVHSQVHRWSVASTTALDIDAVGRVGLALADDSRRRLLAALVTGPGYPSELAAELGLTRANVSNHLSCLRGCGLVVAQPGGRRVRYELADLELARALVTSPPACWSLNPRPAGDAHGRCWHEPAGLTSEIGTACDDTLRDEGVGSPGARAMAGDQPACPAARRRHDHLQRDRGDRASPPARRRSTAISDLVSTRWSR